MLLPISTTEMSKPVAMKVKRNVRFHEARVVSFVTPGSSMTQEERDLVWYQSIDLDGFKTNARNLCRRLRNCPPVGDEEHARGLEHRVSLERQKNKVLAIRCILKAQRRFTNPEHIAMVARKCTAWAQEVAIVQASRDFCDAYHPTLTSLVPDVSSSSQFPFSLKKREAELPVDSASTERSVRQKIEAVC